MGLKSNMDLGVFYTHLGSFLLSAGKFGPFMITSVYLIVFYFLFKEENKWQISKNKDANCLPFEKLMVMFFLLCIPTVGCICYYYDNYYLEVLVYIIIAAVFFFKDDDIQILNTHK